MRQRNTDGMRRGQQRFRQVPIAWARPACARELSLLEHEGKQDQHKRLNVSPSVAELSANNAPDKISSDFRPALSVRKVATKVKMT